MWGTNAKELKQVRREPVLVESSHIETLYANVFWRTMLPSYHHMQNQH